MKCIYCNAEEDLTSSDIITSAITGTKLTKTFVCHTHNAFTNDKYEKKFVSNLDFFRNELGLTTRSGDKIKFKADLLVDGIEVKNVTLSDKESLFEPKGVVAGTGKKGEKVLVAPIEKLKKLKNGTITPIDEKNIILQKSVNPDDFLGECALHSVAKIAYEWYCYINNIEEFKEENREIVDYIFGLNKNDCVEIVTDRTYNEIIDYISRVGTNSLFQYDDNDGYRYVVFDLWKIIAYRVRICKYSKPISYEQVNRKIEIFFYNMDGSKNNSMFSIVGATSDVQHIFQTSSIEKFEKLYWTIFSRRMDECLKTNVLTLSNVKHSVDELTGKLIQYDNKEKDLTQLLSYEDTRLLSTLLIINTLYDNKDKYNFSKSFDFNLRKLLNINEWDNRFVIEDNNEILKELVELDEKSNLSEYMHSRIDFLNNIYKNESK